MLTPTVTAAGGRAAGAPAPGGTLGKDDFLRLLVTQLRYQNPLEPMADLGFIAQLAQFGALEQMQNLNRSAMLDAALALLGRRVAGQDPVRGAFFGLVSAVRLGNGTPVLQVGDLEVAPETVREVLP